MRYQVRNLYRKEKTVIATFENERDASIWACQEYIKRELAYDVVDTEDGSTVGGTTVFHVGRIWRDEE